MTAWDVVTLIAMTFSVGWCLGWSTRHYSDRRLRSRRVAGRLRRGPERRQSEVVQAWSVW